MVNPDNSCRNGPSPGAIHPCIGLSLLDLVYGTGAHGKEKNSGNNQHRTLVQEGSMEKIAKETGKGYRKGDGELAQFKNGTKI